MTEYAGREKEIEAREKAATKGPWENVRPGGIPPGIVCDIDGESWDITEDADFIAHAKQDIPYLLAQLREAREKLAAVEELPLRHDKLPHATGGGCMSRCLACQCNRILKGGE